MLDVLAQLTALLGGPQGPEAAAMLDAAGVPPPSKAMLLGGPKAPVDPFSPQAMTAAPVDANDPGGVGPFPGVAAPQAAAAPQNGGDLNTMKLALAANQGVKAPEPIKPLMSGGVTGGVKVPDAKMEAGTGTQALQALLAALGPGAAGKDPLRVPTLGAIMGGRR